MEIYKPDFQPFVERLKISLQPFISFILKQYFTGNRDQNTVKSYALVPNIRARFIRIRPWGWYGHISMRAEFYGCLTGS